MVGGDIIFLHFSYKTDFTGNIKTHGPQYKKIYLNVMSLSKEQNIKA